MKKVILKIGFILLSMMFAMQSCSDKIIEPFPDDGIEVVPEGDKMVPIALALNEKKSANTYGDTYYGGVTDVPGTSVENAVNDILVYVFDNTYTCEKILYGPSSPVGPEMVRIGTKHFIAVINAQSNVSSLFPLPSDPSTVNYATLRRTLSDARTLLPASPFLMVGERLNVPVTDQRPQTNPYQIIIDVERATAKVTMSFTKSGDAALHNITLQQVIMYKGANKVFLIDRPSSEDIIYGLSTTKNSFSPSGIVSNSPSYVYLSDTIYTYASDCGPDTTKAVRFEITAAINSATNIRTAKFFLGEYEQSPGDTVYDIRRNYWYDVRVNIKDPGMDSLYITVTASPWNVADVIPDTLGSGGEFKTATPFKLVKSYTSADLDNFAPNSNAKFAAIDKHTKGASWVKVKATNGTQWSIELKGGTADPRNQGVMASTDGGFNWIALSNTTHITGTGNNNEQTVYIYRPYREDNEPKLGPALIAKVGNPGQYKHDLIIQPRDTTPIPTNSYVLRPRLSGGAKENETRAYIPLAGVYKYWEDYLLNNGDSIFNGPITATVSWKDRSGDVIKSASVINDNKRDSAYLLVEAGTLQGNAVVNMIVNSQVYWSFHIWVTEYNPYEAAGQKLYNMTVSPYTKTVFMDRNLGALTNVNEANGESRGLYYQFGRKDPFPRGNNWTNTFVTVYNQGDGALASVPPTGMPAAATTLRPKTAINNSIINNRVFYTASSSWPLSQENFDLWSTPGGHKTAFDPCPEGWRIPKQVAGGSSDPPWNGLTATNLSALGYTNGRYYFETGFYPFSGYISGSSITGAPTAAYYWSSWRGIDATSINAKSLNITSTAVITNQDIRKDHGASVRCVVDRDYLFKNNGGLFGKETGILINNTQ